MKYITYCLLLIAGHIFAQSPDGIRRGISSYADWPENSFVCKIENIDESNEGLCIYKELGEELDLILTIESVWNNNVRYPLFVDILESGDDLNLLLEIQEPFNCFLLQKYTKENGTWVLDGEYPIQKMGIIKNTKLVSGRIESMNQVIFSFLPPGEFFMTKRSDGIVRERRITHPEDIQVTYEFLPAGIFVNGSSYDFDQDSAYSMIPGY